MAENVLQFTWSTGATKATTEKKLAGATPFILNRSANLTDISFCVNKILLNGIDLVLKGTGQKNKKCLVCYGNVTEIRNFPYFRRFYKIRKHVISSCESLYM